MNRELVKNLISEMRSGKYQNNKTLPSEQNLASELCISRMALREVLLILEYEGWISRKHGVGTIINRDVLDDVRRLDTTPGILKIIESNGKTPTSVIESHSTIPADERLSAALKMPIGTPLLKFTTLFYGDGKPAVHCTDYYPVEYLGNELDSDFESEPDFFALISKNKRWQEIDTFVSKQKTVTIPDYVAAAMKLPKTTVAMQLIEIGYDIYTDPILFSEQYYLDDDYEYVLVRKYFK